MDRYSHTARNTHRIRSRYLLVLTLIVSLWAGCGKAPLLTYDTVETDNRALAEFDPDSRIPARDVYLMLDRSGVLPDGGVVPDSVVEEFLHSMLVDTLIDLSARDQDPIEFFEQYDAARGKYWEVLGAVYLNQAVEQSVTADSAKVREMYEQYPEQFQTGDLVFARHIMSSDIGFRTGPDSVQFSWLPIEHSLEWAWERAFLLYKMIGFGAPFENLAREYSHDLNSREYGGLLGWVPRGRYMEPFDSIAFSLEPGEFCEPYRDANGWHILLVERRLDEGLLPIDTPSVYGRIRTAVIRQLQFRRGRDLTDSLLEALPLRTVDSLEDVPAFTLPAATPIGFVGVDTIFAGQLAGAEREALPDSGYADALATFRTERLPLLQYSMALVNAARDEGLDTIPEIRHFRDSIFFVHTRRALLAGMKHRDNWLPTDSMVEAYYQEHYDEFNPPRPYVVEQLEVADSSLAAFLAEQTKAGYAMDYLQQEWSGNQGHAVNYVEPRPLDRESVSEQFWNLVKATPKDGVRVLRQGEQYTVFHVVEKLPQRSLDIMRDVLVTRLQRLREERREEAFRDSLYTLFNVKIDESLPTFVLDSAEVRRARYSPQPDETAP